MTDLVKFVKAIVILYMSHCFSNGEIISYKYMKANGEEHLFYPPLNSGISIACARQCSISDETCIGVSVERKEPRKCNLHMKHTTAENSIDYTDSANFVTWLRPGK